MAIKIVIVNKKGGVGKTTTALNLSAFLSSKGEKVLAIDLDSQANLTIGFGINIDVLDLSISEVFSDEQTLENVIVHLSDKFSLVPSRPDLDSVIDSPKFAKVFKKYEVLRYKMGAIEDSYDYIIMDTPPAVESVLTMNALAIADYAIIPILLDTLSLAGLRQVLDVITEVQKQFLNTHISVIGLLATFYQNTNDAKRHLNILENSRHHNLLFRSKIRKNVSLAASFSQGLPITLYDKNSIGYLDYMNFTDELIARLEDVIPDL